MNERIRLLALQAYEDVIENTPSFLVTKELYEQKFAQLIVRECIELIEPSHEFPANAVDQFYKGYWVSSNDSVRKIKQHFEEE
jgi:hypothetical protein